MKKSKVAVWVMVILAIVWVVDEKPWRDIVSAKSQEEYAEGYGSGDGETGQGTVSAQTADWSADETRRVECSLCHGDGICYHCDGEPFQNGRRCSVCDGSGACKKCGGEGSLQVLEIDGKDYTICSSCHGDLKCTVCDGTGKIEVHVLGVAEGDCMICKGKGVCTNCDGAGVVRLRGF